MKKIFIFHIVALSVTIFFLTKVASYENTLLQLNKNIRIKLEYPIFDDDSVNFILEDSNLSRDLYIEKILSQNDILIGYIYNYDEIYEKNFDFKLDECEKLELHPELTEEERRREYDKNSGYFIIRKDKVEYGLSKKELENLGIDFSLKLENIEEYMKKNGERECLKRPYSRLFCRILSESKNSYTIDYFKFEKGNPETITEINKLLFVRNIMVIYLGSNIILCIFFLFKKYNKSIYEDIKNKEKKIVFSFIFDYFIIIFYAILSLIVDLDGFMEIIEFIFYYIILKNFFCYYYLKSRKKNFLLLFSIIFIILIFIDIVFIKNIFHIKFNSSFYYFTYLLSIFSFPFISYKKNEKLENAVLIVSLYLIGQCVYLAVVFLWLYLKMF